MYHWGRAWWGTAVIPATREAKIKRSRQKVREDPSLPHQKKPAIPVILAIWEA
jgi:hypothetical protein